MLVQKHTHTHSQTHPDIYYKSTSYDKILTRTRLWCMMWLCRIKGRNLFGAHTQRNAKKCPRTKSHSPLDNAYRLSQHLE